MTKKRKRQVQRTCQSCGRPFLATSTQARTCSSLCRTALFRGKRWTHGDVVPLEPGNIVCIEGEHYRLCRLHGPRYVLIAHERLAHIPFASAPPLVPSD